jgi:hypothetical protein
MMSKVFLGLGCALVGALAGFAIGYVFWEEENARLSSELAEVTLRHRQAEARLQTPRTALKRGEAMKPEAMMRPEASKPQQGRQRRHGVASEAPAPAGAEEASAGAEQRPGTPAPRRGPPRAESP